MLDVVVVVKKMKYRLSEAKWQADKASSRSEWISVWLSDSEREAGDEVRVVPIQYQYWKMLLIPLKMLISASASTLCTNQIPCYLLAARKYPSIFHLAQLALTDVLYLKSIFLAALTVLRKFCCAAIGNYYFHDRQRRTERPGRASKTSAFSNILHWNVKGDV